MHSQSSVQFFSKFKTVKFYQFVRYMLKYFYQSVFLSMGISTPQFWQRYSVDLSPNNSLIASSVKFVLKFPAYNFLLFCFIYWLDWYCCFWRYWSRWKFFWWCLFFWCCSKLSLVGWASSVWCNSGSSCTLVCCFVNDAA